MQDEKLELSILLPLECPLTDRYTSTGDTSVFWRLQFVTINEKGEVRNPSSSWTHDPYAGFNDLTFRLYISWHSGTFSADTWEVLYDSMHSVTLWRAEVAAKTLKRIVKIRETMLVRPSSFGQYVAMVADALKIKRYAQEETKSNGWHNETPHSFHPVRELGTRIDFMIETARRKKFEPKPEVA